MDSKTNWYGKPIALNAVWVGDDNARTERVRATLEVALLANSGRHAAQLWLPNIENEESTVFPTPQASQMELNREVGEMANNPRIHEIIEDEMIYPAVVLIGK